MQLPSNTAGPRSSFPNSVRRTTTNIGSFFRTRKSSGSRQWRPPALHPATLAFAIAVPLALIITLVLLLRRSQRDNGIIFAPNINDLPLSRTFMYQYFPTILAVVFSIFWAWIDLEVKRLEPYYRLSTDDGALGKDSLLLAYPFGFVPLVPVKAFRQKHWPVFWASIALLLVTWGLVPTQAGIFSTEHVVRNVTDTFEVSTGHMPLGQQQDSLSLRFSQSAYGIVALNETLPPYMARNYTLAPFRPSAMKQQGSIDTDTQEWTAPTTLYSVDLLCELAIPFDNHGIRGWNNSGCVVSLEMDNQTISTGPPSPNTPTIKAFSAQYIGYWNLWGFADFYLSSSCPGERNHTLFAAFTRNKVRESDPVENVTAIFCEPHYYSREVNATVDKKTQRPIRILPLGPKQTLYDTNTIFNTTHLEMTFSGGIPEQLVRGDELPIREIPSFAEQLARTNLSWTNDRQPLVGFSTLINDNSLEDLLDWKTLSRSYADAYRLLFARAMTGVLDTEFGATKSVLGARVLRTDAVALEPIFTFIVIGFLSAIILATSVLLGLTVHRKLKLRSDPSTIGSVMTLVTGSGKLLREFEDLDCCALEQLQQATQDNRYQLVEQDTQTKLIKKETTAGANTQTNVRTFSTLRTVSTKAIDKPVRPIEFSSRMSIVFIFSFAILSTLLTTVFIKARANGLPLPSNNKFVQNLLENYIPTAIATLIEPLWVLINRLLCLLQPIEELQSCKAKAKNSIDLNYSSLPPQLVLFKALRTGHFIVATVCFMALLANVLSVAFAGLFHHEVTAVLTDTNLVQPFDLRFVSIEGNVGPDGWKGPSGAYAGGDGRDQFYTLNSNMSNATPLPPWTDEKLFYLPSVAVDEGNSTDEQFQVETTTMGAELDCQPVKMADLRFGMFQESVNFNVTVRTGGIETRCSTDDSHKPQIITGPFRRLCQSGASALELVVKLVPSNPNGTQEEKNTCLRTVLLGWARKPEGTCKSSNLADFDANNSFFLQCQPRLVRGIASVRVDTTGRLVAPSKIIKPVQDLTAADTEAMFDTDSSGLIAQSNLYIFQHSQSAAWHNDTFAADFLNYFVRKTGNDTRFLDPKRPVPTWEEIQQPLRDAYASLFAVWLGNNKEHLLVPHTGSYTTHTTGSRLANQERIFLSTPLSGTALGILCTYALVSCMVYLRRPGKYLARLPTTLASVIAMFAGSTAVQEMGGMSGLSTNARADGFAKLDFRYGYGSYVGTDGRVHIGIEKTPLVRPWKKTETVT